MAFSCLLALALLDFPALAIALLFSVVALHQQSVAFYNSMIASFEDKSFASGLGVAVGYLTAGVVLGIFHNYLGGKENLLIAFFLILITSLALYLLVPEPNFSESYSLKDLISDKRFLLFILSFFFIAEVGHSTVVLMGLFLKDVLNLSEAQIYKVMGISALGGVAGGLFWGFLGKRISSRKLFILGFFLWIGFLLSVYRISEEIVLFVGLLGGLSLAHLWTISRSLIAEEFSRGRIAGLFSLMSLSDRLSSTVGLWIWSFSLILSGGDMRVSALIMIAFPIIGFFLYLRFLRL